MNNSRITLIVGLLLAVLVGLVIFFGGAGRNANSNVNTLEMAPQTPVQEVGISESSTASPPASNAGVIRIIAPNGGEMLEIGDTVRVSWDAQNISTQYAGLRLEVWSISGDRPIIKDGQCLNCINGGMITLSGVTLHNGIGSVEWEVGKKRYALHTPPGPGDKYVLMAGAERGNTDEETQACLEENPNSLGCKKGWSVVL